MTDFLQRDKLKHFVGEPFLDLCDRKQNRHVHITFNDYGLGPHRGMDMKLLTDVLRIMQKHGVAQSIKFNSNFMNPVAVNLNESVIAHGGSANSGFQKDCLIELCGIRSERPKLAIWASFDPLYWEPKTEHPHPEIYELNQSAVIVDAWVPDDGG